MSNRRRTSNRRHKKNYTKPSQNSFHALLSKDEVVQLLEKDLEELVNSLSREIKWFQASLESDLSMNHLDLVLKLLHRVSCGLTSEGDVCSNAINILGEVFQERCPNFQLRLRNYVCGKISMSQPEQNFRLVCDLFDTLLSRLPESFWSILPIRELTETVKMLSSDESVFEDPNYLLAKVKTLKELHDAIREQKLAKQMRAPVVGQKVWDNTEYRQVQILPQWNEISTPKPPYKLRPNIVEGEYDDWMHYFDVQFRLLREDFISPLRKGIKEYHDGKIGKSLSNLRVYYNVVILRPVFTRAGMCHKISFDTTPFFRCNWEHSKRLIFGSLLCLSPDNFYNKVFFATVTNRDPRDLRWGRVEVMFQDGAEVIVHRNKSTRFVMVESVAFFEASKHILRSLQKAEPDTMPFTKYLIRSDSDDVNPPKYVAHRARLTRYNLTLIVKEEVLCKPLARARFSAMDIRNDASWPSLEETQLDESQLLALKMALTQEVSVIQGPPGTGKTYIGLKIVKALLNNFDIWGLRGLLERTEEDASVRSPILVMCYTNHALDQFLEGIMELDTENNIKLIRVGGRSKNEKLQECNLNEVKRKLRNVPKREYQEMKQLNSAAEIMGARCLIKLNSYKDPADDFVSFSRIRQYISGHHIQSLFEQAETKEEQEYAIELWLGLCIKTVHEELVPVEFQQESLEVEVSSSDEDETESDLESENLESNIFGYQGMVGNVVSEGKQGGVAMDTETIAVEGEGSHEQEARLMEDTLELFEELNLDDVLIKKQPVKFKRTHNIRRVVKIQECENYYYFLKSKMRDVTVTSMNEQEADEIDDVYQLDLNERWQLYKYWHFKYRSDLLRDLEMECMRYNGACEEVRVLRQRNERYALETAHVIGMTTTGAAKYQHILHMLKPRIVIVEEAAEVLESHIVSALNAGTQQLILIGDHKQLRPKPNEYDLAMQYHLDISLFERLVKNNFPHATLQIQHRMRPEIAELVRPHIYETLYNHESVLSYPSVKGISSDLFLINHNQPEQPSTDLSHSNQYEARYLIALCRYLLQHDYQPSQITILVTYTGQLFLMKNEMPKSEFEGVRVTTVDNYQGEENDIILLSLVRSNRDEVIGFLKEENRVCVSLSRAKHGFYCIGNFSMLRKKSDVWQRIVSDMESKERVGNGLSIHCTNHPENKYIARTPQDFAENSPRGGCKLDCGTRLKCGHTCPLKCHTYDSEHLNLKCQKPCALTCSLGHKCQLQCYEECQCTEWVSKKLPNCEHEIEVLCYQNIDKEICYVMVERELPVCNHVQQMLCYEDPADFLCQFMMEKTLTCGHKHVLPCSESGVLHECTELVSKVLPECGHTNDIPCHKSHHGLSFVKCNSPCEKHCPRGHQCQKKCHQFSACPPCSIETEAVLPDCGHTQTIHCHEDPSDIDCLHRCSKTCTRGHPCRLYCYESCQECSEKLQVTPECGHTSTVKCSKVDQFQCMTMIDKTLNCGHTKKVQCSMPLESILCDAVIDVTLKKCGHKQSILCSADPDNAICKEMIEVTLDCGHMAFGQCSVNKSSIKCMELVTKTLKCGHQKVLYCYENIDGVRCMVLCKKRLDCMHTMKVSCYREVTKADCSVQCTKRLPCGHSTTAACNYDISDFACNVPIKAKRPSCDHEIIVPCSRATRFLTMPCTETCRRQLACGHWCQQVCSEPCFCSRKCERKLECGHDCRNMCGKRCTTRCKFLTVKTYPCGHKHRLPCHMPMEHAPCDMICRIPLACGHLCQGMCSECYSTRIHKPCTYMVSLRHYCGERTRLPCSGVSDVHASSKGQVIECPHRSLPWKCSDPLLQCGQPCLWACPKECPKPKTCTKACYELCDRHPCNEKCAKFMDCGHPCVGLCGEPCITLCPHCNPEQFASQHKLSKPFSLRDRYVQLACGHIFAASFMDDYFKQKSDMEVLPVQCPSCFSPLCSGYRYGNAVKMSLQHIEILRTTLKEVKEREPDKNTHILRISSGILRNLSPNWLQRMKSQNLIHCLTVIHKMDQRNFSQDERFLLFILVKFIYELSQSTTTIVHSIADKVFGCLLSQLKSPMLSYQVISDLLSEYFRVILEGKLSKLPPQAITEHLQLLKSVREDANQRISQDMFAQQSRLLDEKARKCYAFNGRATDDILAEIEFFVPVMKNGSWRKCTNGHYYCVPVSQPGILQVQCGQCLGSHFRCISLMQNRKIKPVSIDITEQRKQAIKEEMNRPPEPENPTAGSESRPMKKKKGRKKRTSRYA